MCDTAISVAYTTMAFFTYYNSLSKANNYWASGFAIGLVNSVINLPDGRVNFVEEFKLQKNCEINLLIKAFLGLVEMIFGLHSLC